MQHPESEMPYEEMEEVLWGEEGNSEANVDVFYVNLETRLSNQSCNRGRTISALGTELESSSNAI